MSKSSKPSKPSTSAASKKAAAALKKIVKEGSKGARGARANKPPLLAPPPADFLAGIEELMGRMLSNLGPTPGCDCPACTAKRSDAPVDKIFLQMISAVPPGHAYVLLLNDPNTPNSARLGSNVDAALTAKALRRAAEQLESGELATTSPGGREKTTFH